MVKNRGNLTHHEELRLDYLQKNIHYLNDREQKELAYLEQREQGEIGPSRKISRPMTQDVELPSYREDLRPSASEAEEDDDFILPHYPKEERRRKKSRPKKDQIMAVHQTPIHKPKVKKPSKKVNWVKRVLKGIAIVFLLILVGMLVMFVKGYTDVDQKAEPEVFHGQKSQDGVNILVLGTDNRSGDTPEMTRTDSIIVLNVNNSDHKVKMVSFMRDTLVNIGGNDYKLNLAYTLGQQNGHQGAENLREVLKENYDIDIQHYVMIDFSTFAKAIDTIFTNGVEMDAKFSTIGGQVVDSVEVPDDLGFDSGGSPYQTIKVGRQRMNGKTLLNYARYRSDDEADFGRTRRQQEVISAILSQIKDPTKLFTGSQAIGQVYALTPTTMSPFFMLTNGLPAAFSASGGIEHTTVPENGDWIDAYDVYGGSGLQIDFEKYRQKLADLGFR